MIYIPRWSNIAAATDDRILAAIRNFQATSPRSPLLKEIAGDTGLDINTVSRALRRMEKQARIAMPPRFHRPHIEITGE